jgi:hypothetical protein
MMRAIVSDIIDCLIIITFENQEKKRMSRLIRHLSLFTLFFLSFSCDLIDPPEEIPAYIQIDTILVSVNDFDKGSASHQLDNIWISVGGENMGVFEMPFTIPTYSKGLQTLTIRGGVRLNGIAASRYEYPFFNPYIVDVELREGEIHLIEPATTYKDVCLFRWVEDFEDPGVSVTYSDYSDTTFVNQKTWVKDGRNSGAIFLSEEKQFFEATSNHRFALPENQVPVLFEFDLLSTNTLEVGMYITSDGAEVWNSVVVFYPSDNWKRCYVDIGSYAYYSENMELIRVGFRADYDREDGEPSHIILDNIKLIHYQ